jgi:16S rRNA (adenine1518-N6/adenine1519-N6)-dimethyltransferase
METLSSASPTSSPPCLTSPSAVRTLLARLEVHPRRTWGQCFLIDRNILGILIDAARLSGADAVLEIGAGLGVVTERLTQAAGRVMAIEKDRRLFAYLKERFQGHPGLDLLCADAMDVDVGRLVSGGAPEATGRPWNKIVSNLPYAVASRLLVDLAHAEMPPERMTVTVQWEVARRLTAQPGEADYGGLSVWMQRVYRIAHVKTVSAGCFWPRPDVTSAVVDLERRARSPLTAGRGIRFHAVTKHAFTQRRKQLLAILTRAPPPLRLAPESARALLAKTGIAPSARPESLAVEDWCRLVEEMG